MTEFVQAERQPWDRPPRCLELVSTRSDPWPHRCGNRTNDPSGLCWRHR